MEKGSEGLVYLLDCFLIRSGYVAIDSGGLLLHLAEVMRDLAGRLPLFLYALNTLFLPQLALQLLFELLFLPH